MPIISTSSGLIFLAALLPVAAVPAAVSPDAVAAYTLIGAVLAVLLAVAYMRMHSRQPWNYPQLAFTVLSTWAIGWLVPEPLAWWASRKGWFTPEELETLPKQAWALTALAFGLGGSTVVLVLLHWWRQKFPKAFEEETERFRSRNGTEVKITRTKLADPPTKTP